MLDARRQTGAVLGSLFLFIASFSIIAGIMLLVNIFVMLADERRGQLGMLRAVGMRRRRVTAEFAVEGAVYAGLAAALLGAALGRAGRPGRGHPGRQHPQRLRPRRTSCDLVFAVRPASVVNGIAAGFLIAFLAVVLTSVRIARTNVIAAIRDLEVPSPQRQRRRLTALSLVLTLVFAALAWPAVSSGLASGRRAPTCCRRWRRSPPCRCCG